MKKITFMTFLIALVMIVSNAFAQTPNLMVTEIMYNGPESGIDSTEFVELYNNDTMAINLAGYTFVQGFNYTFPAVTINPNSYIVVAVDSVKFASFFGVPAYEWTSGALNNSGEKIILVNANGDTIDVVDYDDGGVWPSTPDGGGPSLTFCNYSLDNNNGANWSVAINFVDTNAAGDSVWANPGTGCGTTPPPSGDTIPPVVNNVIATTSTTFEIYFSEPVGPSAEDTANYSGVGPLNSALINAAGDMVTLSFALGWVDGTAKTITIANVKDTANNMMPVPQSFTIIYNVTMADLVITEIMYNDLSSSDSLEYFEIYNNGNYTAKLGGYIVTEGVNYTFPANTFLTIGSYLVIAKDSALVNSVFGITGSHQWISGDLKNSGEDIEIQNTYGDILAYVDYDDSSPWPEKADGGGPSIEFCNVNIGNNSPIGWSLANHFVGIFKGDSIFGTPGASCIMVSIEKPELQINDIGMYPNPASDVLFFNNLSSDYEVSIYNVTGSLLEKFNINDSNTSVNIEELNAGLYFVQFVNNNTSITIIKKLIIQ